MQILSCTHDGVDVQDALGLMQESDENDSEADASDADEDAKAKAERLGLHQASRDDVRPASASRAAAGFPQAAGKKRASPANAEGSNKKSKQEYQLVDLMNGSTVKQKSSRKKRKAAREPDSILNGSATTERIAARGHCSRPAVQCSGRRL